MEKFKPCRDTLYTIDLIGIAVSNRNAVPVFIEYPEAAVWQIMSRNYTEDKCIRMLSAILNRSHENTAGYISSCLKNWKEASLID